LGGRLDLEAVEDPERLDAPRLRGVRTDDDERRKVSVAVGEPRRRHAITATVGEHGREMWWTWVQVVEWVVADRDEGVARREHFAERVRRVAVGRRPEVRRVAVGARAKDFAKRRGPRRLPPFGEVDGDADRGEGVGL